MQITADDWRVAIAEAEDLPCVLIGRTEVPHRLSWVDFDFEAAAARMVDHLVQLGHRRIGFIGRPRAMLDQRLGSAVRLQQGYADAVLAHGLEPHQVQSDLDPLAAGQAALHLVDTVPGLTALVATHGPASLGILRTLADRGVGVPGDVSVMSIATPRLATLSSPPLSGVDFPSAELGFQAAGALLRQLDDRAAGMPPRTEQLLLPVQVSLRGSAAAPGTRP
jgi:DNA-binding LacI/PurR family transcriptional regulator